MFWKYIAKIHTFFNLQVTYKKSTGMHHTLVHTPFYIFCTDSDNVTNAREITHSLPHQLQERSYHSCHK